MRIARFWAYATGNETEPGGGPVHIALYRGTDQSQLHADSEAARAIELGRALIREGRARELWYEYQRASRPEPIDQELTDADGRRAAAVTINRHGVSVLNTAWLPFVDVDRTPTAGLAGLFKRHDPVRRLREWADERPGRAARVYRTAAGLRYLLTTTRLNPEGEESAELMRRLGADPLYARLCAHQRSYRARLSPKPWRIGAPRIVLRAAGPPRPEADQRLAEYERLAAGYAVCELLESLGPEPADPLTTEIVALHDAVAGVGSGRPLA